MMLARFMWRLVAAQAAVGLCAVVVHSAAAEASAAAASESMDGQPDFGQVVAPGLEDLPGWVRTNGSGEMAQLGGSLVDVDDQWAIYVYTPLVVGEGAYSFSLKVPDSPGSGSGAAFLWRIGSDTVNLEDCYYLSFDHDGVAGSSRLYHFLAGNATLLGDTHISDRGELFVEIDDNGANVEIFVNGQSAYSVAGLSDMAGRVGVSSGWGAGHEFFDMYAPVPEPGAVGMAALGFGLILRRRRR